MTRIQDFTITEGRNMLVLSRKLKEAIVIGNGITVSILAVDGERVKLGIVAPAEIPVHRQEVRERIAGDSCHLRLAGCA
jgi:carbon storage regulator